VIGRALVVAALLGAAGSFAALRASEEPSVTREALASLPMQLGDWRGIDAPPFADDVVAQLGVDEHIHRRYVRAGAAPIGVYIGYYGSQRQGDAIHSPQNCLPGAGWHPLERTTETLKIAGSQVGVNRFVIANGLDRQVVFYWYQGRGRVIANEYANKLMLMFDAARVGRTNGGLVRLMTPVGTSVDAATGELSAFAGRLLVDLNRYLP
jgi:EpsI family protein